MLSQAEMLRNNSRSVLPSPPVGATNEEVSLFHRLAGFMTCLIPDWMIHRIGGMSGAQIQAWREKVTLCMLIFMNCMLLGGMTYGVNRFVCRGDTAQMVYGKLTPDAFHGRGTIVANGGIFYSNKDHGIENMSHMFKKNSQACERAFKRQLTNGKLDANDYDRISDMYYSHADIASLGLIVIKRKVYDPSYCKEPTYSSMIERAKGGSASTSDLSTDCVNCFKDTFYCGRVATKSNGCIFGDILLWCTTVIIFSLILVKFFLAIIYAWYSKKRTTAIRGNTPVILQVTCYSEGVDGLRLTLDSLTALDYPDEYKLIIVVADGEVRGQGNDETTPSILRSICDVDDCEPLPYISLAPGHKRHNRATVHAGKYRANGRESNIILINKCGNPGETAKAGNRGKRDSQVITMSFFSKLLYKERLSPLDHGLHRKMARLVPACRPEDFEILLMVDADTVVSPNALAHMVSVFEHDPKVMGLCGETQIVNKSESWVTRIQVFEYYISHHLAKNFESVFGGVTCLPGCFCCYRIKIITDDAGCIKNHADKKLYENEHWECVPILANPLIVAPYSIYEARTLHEKNLLHLGEDRYLTTLLMKNFYKRKLIFLAAAKCQTCVPADYATLRSQRRRWINSTIHNMFELVVVDKLCGTFCFSMQFIIFFELFGTLTLPAAIIFTFVLLGAAIMGSPAWIPLIMLAGILGLPAVLIMFTTFEISYWYWLVIYIFALPIWNFMLPVYAFWKFDDVSWGETRKIEGGKGADELGVFDPSSVRLTHLHEQ